MRELARALRKLKLTALECALGATRFYDEE
jgi:hypothetical protein